MGVSILDRLNARHGTNDHTIADALKSYIIRNGGDPSGLQSIGDLVAALPEGGGGGITPTGNLPISENGTYDVTNYAEATVNVSGGKRFVIYGSYEGSSTPGVIPDDFPLGNISDIVLGHAAYVLYLTQTYKQFEEDEDTVTEALLYPHSTEGRNIIFAQPWMTYFGENSNYASIEININAGTASITEWRNVGGEMDDHYNYLDGRHYDMDGNPVETDPPFYNHVGWILYAFTYDN